MHSIGRRQGEEQRRRLIAFNLRKASVSVKEEETPCGDERPKPINMAPGRECQEGKLEKESWEKKTTAALRGGGRYQEENNFGGMTQV